MPISLTDRQSLLQEAAACVQVATGWPGWNQQRIADEMKIPYRVIHDLYHLDHRPWKMELTPRSKKLQEHCERLISFVEKNAWLLFIDIPDRESENVETMAVDDDLSSDDGAEMSQHIRCCRQVIKSLEAGYLNITMAEKMMRPLAACE